MASQAPDGDIPGTVEEAEELVLSAFEVAAAEADGAYSFERAVLRELDHLIPDHPLHIPAADELTSTELSEVEIVFRAACWAVRYHIEIKGGRASLVPRLVVDEDSDPPRPKDVGERVVSVWRRLADATTASAASARLSHLLFQVGDGDGRVTSAAAIAGYLALIPTWRRGALVDVVASALDLSRRTRQEDLAAEVVAVIGDLTRQSLGAVPPEPGVSLRLLDLIASEPDPPTPVDELLSLSLATYSETRTADQVHGLRLKRARGASEAVAEIHRDRVRTWLDAAASSSGVMRAVLLEQAVQRAQESSQPPLTDEAVARLQDLRSEDLGMMTISSSMQLRYEEVEEWLAPVLEARDWPGALDAFVDLGPLSGHVEANRAYVEQQQVDLPLSGLFPPKRVGGDGLPRFEPRTNEERFEFRLAEHETHHIQHGSGLLAEALERIRERFGVPTQAEIAAHLGRQRIVPAATAVILGGSFQRYWYGDHEGAAFTALPAIESLARQLLLTANSAIYRTQRGSRTGQYPGLGVLLDSLADVGLDPSWHRYMKTLLAGPSGMNLRNEALHGFITMGPVYAAPVLQVAAYLTMLGPNSPADE